MMNTAPATKTRFDRAILPAEASTNQRIRRR